MRERNRNERLSPEYSSRNIWSSQGTRAPRGRPCATHPSLKNPISWACCDDRGGDNGAVPILSLVTLISCKGDGSSTGVLAGHSGGGSSLNDRRDLFSRANMGDIAATAAAASATSTGVAMLLGLLQAAARFLARSRAASRAFLCARTIMCQFHSTIPRPTAPHKIAVSGSPIVSFCPSD